MAYTSPPTWIPGDAITDVLLNTYVGDNFDALADARTTYVPTLTATTANPTLGSGSIATGRYLLLNKLCVVHVDIQFGTSGTAAGTGDYIVSLPADPKASTAALSVIGGGLVYDSSATTRFGVFAERSAASAVKLSRDGTSGLVGAAAPFAWGASDAIHLDLVFEVT
jgi:hypothetical protein